MAPLTYKVIEANAATFCIVTEASVATNMDNLGEASVAIFAEASVAMLRRMSPQTKKQSRRRGAHVRVQVFFHTSSICIHPSASHWSMQSEAENYAAEQLANLQKIYAAEQLANAKSLGQLPLRSTASSVNRLQPSVLTLPLRSTALTLSKTLPPVMVPNTTSN